MEYFVHALLLLCGALEVVECANLVGRVLCVMCRHWLLPLLCKVFDKRRLRSGIGFATHKDKLNARTKVSHFRDPLFWNVFQGIRLDNAVADQQDISVRVR